MWINKKTRFKKSKPFFIFIFSIFLGVLSHQLATAQPGRPHLELHEERTEEEMRSICE